MLEQGNSGQKEQSLFREKTLKRISSPEKLTDYLRVTNPGVWVLLAVVILLLGGMLIWASVGTLETTVSAKIIVKENVALVAPEGNNLVKDGMPLRINDADYVIQTTTEDEYGRVFGMAEVTLPDGTYEGVVVTEQIRPIDFLFESR